VSLVCFVRFCLTPGVDERELAGLRTALLEFAEEVFAGFARADQRANGVRYLRGLMLDGQRKSMQPMAARLGVDHQQLQQFMTSSTWDYVAVRRRLAARLIELIEPVAWVIDDTGFAKDGNASPGVARQYSGTLGKVGNCQIAVSVHAATTRASGVLGWRLYLGRTWDVDYLPAPTPATVAGAQDGPAAREVAARREAARRRVVQALKSAKTVSAATAKAAAVAGITEQEHARMAELITTRRARAGIPDEQGYQPKWQLALDLIDELIRWGHLPPVLVADAGYCAGEFRVALSERDLTYMLAASPTLVAYPADAVLVPPTGRRQARYEGAPATLKDLALAGGRAVLTKVTWRQGTKSSPTNPTAAMSGSFHALRVRPAGPATPRDSSGALPECWLLIEWPPDKAEPTDYWLSTLPTDTPLKTLVRTAKIRWRIEHDYRELKTGLGLDHFEGRTFTGWHRHATLVSAAQLFLTTLRLQNPKADGQT
jgi:SRSO17 transposase